MAVSNMLAKAGHEVVILNRDIKFGGLAEYGIFPSKLKLRGGLKKQYWEMLAQPNVHYFGNVAVGSGKDLTVEDLRGLGASAIVFSIGAQGTKAIGVEGDSAKGVFHAKDVVYHFNRLPGFGDRPFEVGKHVAIIGVGDVMVDIAHWLIRYKKVERVTAIAQREARGVDNRSHERKTRQTNSAVPTVDRGHGVVPFRLNHSAAEYVAVKYSQTSVNVRCIEVSKGLPRHSERS